MRQLPGLVTLAWLFSFATGHAFASGPEGAASRPFGLDLGTTIVVSPTYEGSSSHRVLGVPFVAPTGLGVLESGTVQFRGLDDLRFRLFRAGPLELGPLVGWRMGRDEDDGNRLAGLGDIDGGLVAGGYVAAKFGHLKPFLSYHHQVTGDSTGAVARFGTEAEMKLDRGVKLTAVLGTTYADEDYMQNYFGISAAQSAASLAGLQQFVANAGFKDVYLGVSGTFPLNDTWTMRAGVKYTRLIGDAADSPVVETADQFSGSVGLSYRFGWGR